MKQCVINVDICVEMKLCICITFDAGTKRRVIINYTSYLILLNYDSFF